jgi:hypothetical protein
VDPQALYRRPACDGILLLQRGENASTDYFLRPRLQHAHVPHLLCDLDSSPADCPLMAEDGPGALMVIFCRYGAESWFGALRERRDRLARVAFFMDDDLPQMMRDPDLPRAVRGKAALHFGAQLRGLSELASEVWVSTPVLAERYPDARARVLQPIPEADPPEPERDPPRTVIYHGTDVHPRERLFVLEIARRLADAEVTFELTGGAALAGAAADLPRVAVTPQLAWPQYLRRQAAERAAISLAPLLPSRLNAGRAPVKAFDAARIGAAGLFGDCEPYRSFVHHGQDGLLLPMEPAAWADAITALLADPERRLRLATTARERLIGMRRRGLGLPAPPP